MRLLFEMDKKDYADCTHVFARNSARSIIIRNNQVAMVHSLKYDYYKFPGGGIEKDETPIDALIRETAEESGLIIKRETVREYGYVHRILRSNKDLTECFIQDNFYYFCEAEDEIIKQKLVDYELDEQYCLEFIDAEHAIAKNLAVLPSPYDRSMFEREVRVLKMLIKEGFLL